MLFHSVVIKGFWALVNAPLPDPFELLPRIFGGGVSGTAEANELFAEVVDMYVAYLRTKRTWAQRHSAWCPCGEQSSTHYSKSLGWHTLLMHSKPLGWLSVANLETSTTC